MGYTLEQPRVTKQLTELGVKIVPNAIATKWDESLHLQDANTGASLEPLFGTLVPVGLRAPNLSLWTSIGSSENKTLLGDAEAPGIIQSAVFAGHKAARKFLNDGIEPAIKRERGMLLSI
jgi:dimethylamine/trimethylamine dehydrogenase